MLQSLGCPLPARQAMKTAVLNFVVVVVLSEAQAGLELFNNEKRSVFDIIPEGKSMRLNTNFPVKCLKDGGGKCISRIETVFKQSADFYDLAEFKEKLKQNSKNELKMEIKKYFKTKSRKRPDHPSRDELKKGILNYIRNSSIKMKLMRRIIQM